MEFYRRPKAATIAGVQMVGGHWLGLGWIASPWSWEREFFTSSLCITQCMSDFFL